VIPGAALQIQGGIAVGAEALSLNGTGIASDGALRNISGTNTYAGLVTLAGSTRINSDAGSLTLSNTGTITGAGSNLTVGGSGNTVINSAIGTGSGALTKDGIGTLTLGAVNTYTGTTTVNAGTLKVDTSAALTNTSNVTVNTGGTLLLSGTNNDKINNAATVTLNGGTITLGGSASLDERVGALTLSSSSIIDFGGLAAGEILRFADSQGSTWNPSAVLSIYNWTSGYDHLYFGSVANTGLTSGQIPQIKFYSDGGQTLLSSPAFGPNAGEISPVPEASTVLVGLILCSMVGYRERRRLGRFTNLIWQANDVAG
jgi:autotransporter-associated beta strand protein